MRQSILDAIPAKVALLDATGKIIAVSRGWTKFCEATGVKGGIADDYLAVCWAFASGDTELLEEATTALRGVLSEGRINTTFRYPRGEGKRKRWYRARLVPYVEDAEGSGAIVMHFDVTERPRRTKPVQARSLRRSDQVAKQGGVHRPPAACGRRCRAPWNEIGRRAHRSGPLQG